MVQGDNTHAVQGSDNQTVIGNKNVSVDGQGNIIYYNQTPAEKRPRLERSLLSSVEKEVNDRLRQSLHNRVFIELGKQQVPETIRRPWDADVKVGNQAPEPIPDGKTIIDVFRRDDVAGKLLILGHPGAGKTTTMLELAAALIEQAKQDVEQPIPVLFNLSSWQDDKQPIADWLVQELKAKYGVSAALGKEWLATRKLSPLLDGLEAV